MLSDCWKAEERGSATAVYSLAPFLGPAIGPIGMYDLDPTTVSMLTGLKAGGYLTQYMDWRWIFWVVSMADALVQVNGP